MPAMQAPRSPSKTAAMPSQASQLPPVIAVGIRSRPGPCNANPATAPRILRRLEALLDLRQGPGAGNPG
ncbi:hypothetical protein FIV38_14595 [Pseudomonas proteolytica]|nr:hypothetical protein F4W61_14460 [Pseudomonas proteolytica]QHG23601.1 hypothetical protein GDV60_12305 [Pseudomonas sp. DTU12.1]TWR81693.1 hypothetical protein FIV38_14595 [Pseudomonas proteolytica]